MAIWAPGSSISAQVSSPLGELVIQPPTQGNLAVVHEFHNTPYNLAHVYAIIVFFPLMCVWMFM